jgi:hypothetical protein
VQLCYFATAFGRKGPVAGNRLGIQSVISMFPGVRLSLAAILFLLASALSGGASAQSSAHNSSPVALPIALPGATQVAASPSVDNSWMADKASYFRPFDLAWNDGRWFVSGYFGHAARSELSQLLFRFDANYAKQYVVLGTLGREIGSLGNLVRFEWETGLGVHFGRQEFVDAHLYFVARWIWFPWNRWVPTTIAIGTGPSLASKRPELENEKGEAGHYKNGFMMELTVAPPTAPDWMLAARIHHRSSFFGLLQAGTPSDYVTIGIKHRF